LASQPAAAIATAARDITDAVDAVLYQLNAAHKASNYSIINRRGAVVSAGAGARRDQQPSVIGQRVLTGIDRAQ